MKTVQREHEVATFKSKLMDQYFQGLRMGVFDIETMGLSAENFPMVLAGILTPLAGERVRVTQYFAEEPGDEAMIIGALRRHFQEIDYLVTYNGRQFDLPFLRKRALKLGLPSFRCNYCNLDLYAVIKSYSEFASLLPDGRQKTIEAYMGFATDRRDTISGAESIKLYESFQRCSDDDLKTVLANRILLHNHDDLLQLYRLLPVIRQTDFHRAINSLGFPVRGENGWPSLHVTRARAVSREFEIKGQYNGPAFSYVSYDTFLHYYSCEFYDDGDFVFKIPVERHKGNSFIRLNLYFDDFADLKQYPGFANGFLLVTRGLEPCHLESSMLAQKFLREFMRKTACPLASMYPL